MSSDEKPEAVKPSWTVMLYMAASKDEQTESAAILNAQQLQEYGARDGLNLLVQIDRRWPGYAERYRLTGHTADNVPFRGRQKNDSGESSVLHGFVKWAREEAPADHYLLVLWGHAFGLGFGRDNGDPLTLPEIAKALDPKSFGLGEDDCAVDILGVNACAMSYAEAVYELRRTARYLVAPQITMPFAGWPYETVLGEIVKGIAPADLAARIVDDFVASFEDALEPRSVALTAVRLGAAGTLEQHVAGLTHALAGAIEHAALKQPIADAFLDTAHAEVRPLIDLVDLCDRLSHIAEPGASSLNKAAITLREFLNRTDEHGLLLRHRTARDVEGLNGLGIYAPSVTGAADLSRLQLDKKQYEKLALVEQLADPNAGEKKRPHGWADIVFTDLGALLAPINRAIAEFVNATGAVGTEDRTGVGQLLLSVYRAFVKLEDAASDAQRQLKTIVCEKSPLGASRAPDAPDVIFGRPFLRLAPDRAPLFAARALSSSAVSSASIAPPDTNRLRGSVAALAKLEDALASLEKTLKRVMTNARFGLGDDQIKFDLGDDQIKFDLGDDQIKFDLGDDQIKFDLGDDQIKFDLGMVRGAASTARAANGTAVVAEMFRQVAWSLKLMEEAVAKIEGDIQSALSGSTLGAESDEYQRLMREQLDQSFRGLREMIANARSTVFSILAHPADGLGPSTQTASRIPTRQQLATAGGLSSRNLQLL